MKMEPANIDHQYRKFPDMKREEVLKLVEWIKQQPHMPNLTEGDAILFFHACRYSMELTKRTIDTCLTIRTHCPELFHNWDIERPELKKAMNTVSIAPLPKSTVEGYRVIVAKLVDTDSSNFNFADVMKLYIMIFELWIVENGAEDGYIAVVDMKGATLGHIARMGIMTVKKFLVFLQEAAAVRVVGFHFVNIVPFMDTLLALVTPFMKKELLEMMHLHNSLDTFHKFVPKKLLPPEYGGLEDDTSSIKDACYKKMIENRDFLMDLERTHQVNEKLRPGKPKNASDLFGLEGNFRKLDID